MARSPRTARPVVPLTGSSARAADAALGPEAAVADHTTVLYDPATGTVAGAHRVLTLPGGHESVQPDAAAEALEITPAQRARLASLRHDGAVADDRVLSVRLVGGRATLALLKRVTAKRAVAKRAGR